MTARALRICGVLLVVVVGAALAIVAGGHDAEAQEAPVGLGTASSFAVLGGQSVTNTGPSVISGDIGVSPGTSITGFPPGVQTSGAIYANTAEAASAQADLTTAYNDAAGRTPATAADADFAGETLVPGLYGGPTLGNTGQMTLDAQGDPSAVWIFQAESTLITASGSSILLVNGADPCNVYWQIGSSATLGTNSTFVGTLMALTSITAQTGATIEGRLLARNGSTTLDSNTITSTVCAQPLPPTTTTSSPPTTSAPTTSPPTTSPPATSPPTTTDAGAGAGAGAGTGGPGAGATGAGAGGPGAGAGAGDVGAGATGAGAGAGAGDVDAGAGGAGAGGAGAGDSGAGPGGGAGDVGTAADDITGAGAGAGGAASGLDGELPHTGAALSLAALTGTFAVLMGSVLLMVGRRREPKHLLRT